MNHRAKKSLGQNFLVDQNICRKIVSSIKPGHDDHIIEIGPGQGALTQHIVEHAPRRFTVIERDDDLAEALIQRWPNVEVVQDDALKFPWHKLNEDAPCKIIGNLPYNIGSKLIWDIVSQTKGLQRAVFMVQHEVALRLTAECNSKAYGGLTAWVKNFAATEYLFKVPPSVFRPQPKVDSAVVAFYPLPINEHPGNPDALSVLIKMLFQKRRKQLGSILKKKWSPAIEEWFEKEGISSTLRPENLTPQQFRSLSLCI